MTNMAEIPLSGFAATGAASMVMWIMSVSRVPPPIPGGRTGVCTADNIASGGTYCNSRMLAVYFSKKFRGIARTVSFNTLIIAEQSGNVGDVSCLIPWVAGMAG
ncbi:MAG: hypothetical protein R3C12_09800 [Planctomycetaceae bacterium]